MLRCRSLYCIINAPEDFRGASAKCLCSRRCGRSDPGRSRGSRRISVCGRTPRKVFRPQARSANLTGDQVAPSSYLSFSFFFFYELLELTPPNASQTFSREPRSRNLSPKFSDAKRKILFVFRASYFFFFYRAVLSLVSKINNTRLIAVISRGV